MSDPSSRPSAVIDAYEFIVIGISHHVAPMSLLESAAVPSEKTPTVVAQLKTLESVLDAVVLSTCNRVEFFLVAKDATIAIREALHYFVQHASNETIRQHLYSYSGLEAVRHLYRVTSSLDSLVPGEAQILGQVKEAWETRQHKVGGSTHKGLDRLIRKAISVAKRVRTETRVGEQPVSIASAGVRLAERIFGRLKGTRVLLLGSGKMGTLAAKHLKSAGAEEIVVSSRNYDNALELARQFDETAIPWHATEDYLLRVDIVVVATGAPEYILLSNQLRPIMEQRQWRPLFIIDLAMPRNVEPSVHKLENVYLYNIENLKAVVDANLKGRHDQIEHANRIIEEQAAAFLRTMHELRFDNTIGDLVRMIEEQLRSGIHQSQGGKQLSETAVEKMASALTRRILQNPLRWLKEEAAPEQIDSFRRAFALDSDNEHLVDSERHLPSEEAVEVSPKKASLNT